MTTKKPGDRQIIPAAFKRYGRGWRFIPLHKHTDVSKDRKGKKRKDGKRPLHANWTKRTYDSTSVLAGAIKVNRNVGVRLKATQLVIDVDPRNGGTRGFKKLCAKLDLEPSDMPHVITGSGGSHYYLTKPADVLIRDTIEGFEGVEFKSIGRQVVAAGSIHPDSLKPYRWDPDHPPIADAPECPANLLDLIKRPPPKKSEGGGETSPEELAEALSALDPEDFRDHDKWLQVLMASHHATAGDGRAEFIEWSIGDPVYADDADMIGRRWDSLHAKKDSAITYKTLNMFLSDADASDKHIGPAGNASDDFAEAELDEEFDTSGDEDDSWMEAPDAESASPKGMKFDMTKLPAMLDYAEKAMLAADVPLYQTGGRVVHPVRVDKDSNADDAIRRAAGALIIQDVSALRLREYMIADAPFYRVIRNPKTGKGAAIRHAAPVQLANHYLARGDKWGGPVLRGIVETPTLRSDGSLLTSEGYDRASGLILDLNGVKFPAIKNRPTDEDVADALAMLIEPFSEFPFVNAKEGKSASRSVILSAVLTALVRRTLRTAPLHATDAPTMGTGKTLAIDAVSLIATGRVVTSVSQGATPEEDEKRLFSMLLAGDQIVHIDNVSRPIESDALCTVLTQTVWQNRILGESRTVTVPTNCLITACGNNITFKGDMRTRAIVCRMDSKEENPEKRRFKLDLKREIPKRRAELVVAGLTILRGFVAARRPGLDRLTPFGRFEDWSNLVRGALVWLGEPDPCKTRARIIANDPARANLQQLLWAMHGSTFGWFTASDLIKTAEAETDDDALSDAISNAAPGGARALGTYLTKNDGVITNGLRLGSRDDKKRKIKLFSIEEV